MDQFSHKDLQQIQNHGLTVAKLDKQIKQIKQGFPPTHLDRPATSGDGVFVLSEDQKNFYKDVFEAECSKGRFTKFVPASGAASRMFKNLYHFDSLEKPVSYEDVQKQAEEGSTEAQEFLTFLSGFKSLPFYQDVVQFLDRPFDEDRSFSSEEIKAILELVLTENGLNYGSCPKGLVKFHKYDDHARCAFEEHLAEAVAYVKDQTDKVKVHFTIANEWKAKIQEELQAYQSKLPHVKWEIKYSVQSPKTDTIALDMNDEPFRDDHGELVFRPGGHGSLLKNLNELRADLVFVKNIDNVVPDRLKETTIEYKKVIGGLLVWIQQKIFQYLEQIQNNELQSDQIDEIMLFVKRYLGFDLPEEFDQISFEQRKGFLFHWLNRPIRVCGMVKNQGEPGGGPFWIKDQDGRPSLQIVEPPQVNSNDEHQKKIFEQGAYFNPVDLVCGLKDFQGHSFELNDFVDENTGLVLEKTSEGKKLKALEWPSLWGGSMAHWITVLVDVPLITFNPVKTVNDLLREEHLFIG